MLQGCALTGQSVETGLSGCSLMGLQALDFYSGAPSKGRKITPDVEEDGTHVWNFTFSSDTYVVCGYVDEEEVVQQLPPSMSSCKASFTGPDKTVSDLSCKARI